jgi:hypothetical protein
MHKHLSLIVLLGLGATLMASEPSPLAGHSFLIFHPTSSGGVHRCTLRFNRDGNAFSDLFPVNSIPATGTIKTKTQRSRRGRGMPTISEFSAHGEAPFGKGTVTFTAALDGGQGAKGDVTVKLPNKDPLTITFKGRDT